MSNIRVEALKAGSTNLYLTYNGVRYKLGKITVIDGVPTIYCLDQQGLPGVIYKESSENISSIQSNRYYSPISIGLNKTVNFIKPTGIIINYEPKETSVAVNPRNFKNVMTIISDNTDIISISGNIMNAKSKGSANITVKDGNNIVCQGTVSVEEIHQHDEILTDEFEFYIENTDIARLRNNTITGKSEGVTSLMMKYNDYDIKLFDINVSNNNSKFIRNLSFIEIVT